MKSIEFPIENELIWRAGDLVDQGLNSTNMNSGRHSAAHTSYIQLMHNQNKNNDDIANKYNKTIEMKDPRFAKYYKVKHVQADLVNSTSPVRDTVQSFENQSNLRLGYSTNISPPNSIKSMNDKQIYNNQINEGSNENNRFGDFSFKHDRALFTSPGLCIKEVSSNKRKKTKISKKRKRKSQLRDKFVGGLLMHNQERKIRKNSIKAENMPRKMDVEKESKDAISNNFNNWVNQKEEEINNMKNELSTSSNQSSMQDQNHEFNNLIGNAMEKLRVLKNKLIVKSNCEEMLSDSYCSPSSQDKFNIMQKQTSTCPSNITRLRSPVNYVPLRQKEHKQITRNFNINETQELDSIDSSAIKNQEKIEMLNQIVNAEREHVNSLSRTNSIHNKDNLLTQKLDSLNNNINSDQQSKSRQSLISTFRTVEFNKRSHFQKKSMQDIDLDAENFVICKDPTLTGKHQATQSLGADFDEEQLKHQKLLKCSSENDIVKVNKGNKSTINIRQKAANFNIQNTFKEDQEANFKEILSLRNFVASECPPAQHELSTPPNENIMTQEKKLNLEMIHRNSFPLQETKYFHTFKIENKFSPKTTNTEFALASNEAIMSHLEIKTEQKKRKE